MIGSGAVTEWWHLALVAVAVGVVCDRGISWVIGWAGHRMLDVPGARSSHSIPTPRGGGLPVAVCVLGGSAILALVAQTPQAAPFVGYAVGALLVSSVSLLDDLRGFPPLARLLTHLLAGTALIVSCGYWTFMGADPGGLGELNVPGIVVTMLWVVGLTNAYNFMDGVDGIAASMAAVSGTAWFMILWAAGVERVAGLPAVLVVCCLVFLRHNWPPARVFLGDVGSAFIGYTLAAIPLLAGATSPPRVPSAISPVVAGLVVWPVIADTVFTLIARVRRGERVTEAHRSHVYQRLVLAGCSHRRVAGLYAALTVVGCGLAVLVRGSHQVYAMCGALVAVAGLGGAVLLTVVRLERMGGSPRR